MRRLSLCGNIALAELNLGEADFLSLTTFDVGANVNIASASLRNTVVSQTSLAALHDGGGTESYKIGIGELPAITEMDLSGIDFGDITDLSPLYVMDDLIEPTTGIMLMLGMAAMLSGYNRL